MLYQLHELRQAWLAPVHATAAAMQHFFSNPAVPLARTEWGRMIAASSEIVERATRSYRKPGWGITGTVVGGTTVKVEIDTVARTTFCDLLHFRRDTAQGAPRVLLVAPLSGHYATLLRGTVQGLLPDHDVYVTDWHNAAGIPLANGRFDLDDYVDLVIGFLHELGPEAHVIAVCQPSVPVLAAVSIMAADSDPCTPRSMTLMGGPIDTRVNPTRVNQFAARHSLDWFERTVVADVPFTYPGFMRRVYPGFLQLTGFMTMNIDRHLGSAIRHFQHLVRGDGDSAAAHREFYDEYNAVMDLTAEFYLQTIKVAFQDHALPNHNWVSRGRKVDPRAITRTGVMTVEGELDDISGPGQTFAAHALCPNVPAERHKHRLQMGTGHFGIFNGRKWRTEILPEIRSFIRANG
jgi:poly(3-hydroxybutyrate) depolymerase